MNRSQQTSTTGFTLSLTLLFFVKFCSIAAGDSLTFLLSWRSDCYKQWACRATSPMILDLRSFGFRYTVFEWGLGSIGATMNILFILLFFRRSFPFLFVVYLSGKFVDIGGILGRQCAESNHVAAKAMLSSNCMWTHRSRVSYAV